MKENLFRKESLDRIRSAGQLNECIRVADPGVWLMLAAIVLLLVGTIVWGVFGTIETKAAACVVSQDGVETCYISMEDAKKVQEGMAVRVGKVNGSISAISYDAIAPAGEAALYMGGETCCAAQLELDIADGVYEASVVLESISPISFVTQ